MTKGKVEYAERKAMENFDKWNECTWFVTEHTSYYYEIEANIKDAVHIWIQMALNWKIEYNKEWNVKHSDLVIK